jgi:hypothetical protein
MSLPLGQSYRSGRLQPSLHISDVGGGTVGYKHSSSVCHYSEIDVSGIIIYDS